MFIFSLVTGPINIEVATPNNNVDGVQARTVLVEPGTSNTSATSSRGSRLSQFDINSSNGSAGTNTHIPVNFSQVIGNDPNLKTLDPKDIFIVGGEIHLKDPTFTPCKGGR